MLKTRFSPSVDDAHHERRERDDEPEPVRPLALVGDAVACRDAGELRDEQQHEELAEEKRHDRLRVEQEHRDLQRLGLRRVEPPAGLHG